jgi:hypothetical protein
MPIETAEIAMDHTPTDSAEVAVSNNPTSKNHQRPQEKPTRRSTAWRVIKDTAADLTAAARERGIAYRDGKELPVHELTAAAIRRLQHKFPAIPTPLGPISTGVFKPEEVGRLVQSYINLRDKRRANTAPPTSKPVR